MSKSVSRMFLDKLRGKSNTADTANLSNINEGQLRSLAGKLNKNDFEDEAKLRQLIRTLSAMSGTAVTPEKEEKILTMFREKQIDLNNVQALKKLL